MKLKNLKLRNFKGIKDFDLVADGKNIKVYGDNATGKTTLFDSFVWLLFDKDSQNKKDFQIKTLGALGDVIHYLDHEVEGSFEVADKTLTLRKVYSEKWTKKRGSVTQEFSGHSTEYYIDGVPVKKNEYSDRIAQIAPEDVFKLLTSPTYFNEQLHWQDKRKALIQVCGDISDEEVIASNEKLSKLQHILNGRKLEDHRKVIASRRADINKELERIPVRIDEAQRALPDISELNKDKISKEIRELKELMQIKQSLITMIENGGEVAEKQKKLREFEGELLQIKNELRGQIDIQTNDKRTQLNKLKDSMSELNSTLVSDKRVIERNEIQIKQRDQELQKLRSKWHEVDTRKFEYHQDCNCPTCGQALPESRLEEARQKALSKFNLDKATDLEKISKDGRTIKTEIEQYKALNIEYETKIIETETKQLKEKSLIEEIEKDMIQLQVQANEASSSALISEKLMSINLVKTEIETLKSSTYESIQKAKTEIAEINNDIQLLEKDMANIVIHKRGQDRIEELKKQEKDLAKEFEKLESELYLTEEFIRAKVSMLEERINSKFKYTKFKLFDVQINGGVVECCETMYQGVPYSSGLNNAARINVGLDIINTLAEYHEFHAPIFIDNRESIVKLIETKGQAISLIVSEADKNLRVEVE